MELYWHSDNSLKFQVHLKKNQQLKYLNKGSAHTRACLEAIPYGVLNRLAKLTTKTPQNEHKRLDEIYPLHADALRAAQLNPSNYPTLKELQDARVEREENSKSSNTTDTREHEKIKKTRETFFCIGFSSIWTTPIHKILHDLRNKYNLKWLRPAMSYHKFSNLREKFSADLTSKIMQGIKDKDWMNLPCNCNSVSKLLNRECLYQGLSLIHI